MICEIQALIVQLTFYKYISSKTTAFYGYPSYKLKYLTEPKGKSERES